MPSKALLCLKVHYLDSNSAPAPCSLFYLFEVKGIKSVVTSENKGERAQIIFGQIPKRHILIWPEAYIATWLYENLTPSSYCIRLGLKKKHTTHIHTHLSGKAFQELHKLQGDLLGNLFLQKFPRKCWHAFEVQDRPRSSVHCLIDDWYFFPPMHLCSARKQQVCLAASGGAELYQFLTLVGHRVNSIPQKSLSSFYICFLTLFKCIGIPQILSQNENTKQNRSNCRPKAYINRKASLKQYK